MIQPVLFLDIDGVLHPGSGMESGLLCRAKELEAALLGFEVRIVVSSSWRFHMAMDGILKQLPPDIARRVVDATGEAHVGRWPRYNEIRRWVERHARFADWRALDDARLEFPSPCPELIACDPRRGFGPDQAVALRTWLSAKR